MGTLTLFLQKEFVRLCPDGWKVSTEKKLLHDEMRKFLGYGPRVDVLLEKNNSPERLWVEFEVSRADPVANHAKFATSHLFHPQNTTDSFISMISPHVARGRRNLAANTIFLMRSIGMSAFQTVLFPHIEGKEIKRINHLDQESIAKENLDIQAEIDRVFAVSTGCFSSPFFNIHYVGDILEVMLNIHSWNEGVATDKGSEKWKKRTVAYFAYDHQTKSFAPAKFCAYTIVKSRTKSLCSGFENMSYSKMTIEDYVRIDASKGIFDGNKAWVHLTSRLGMLKIGFIQDPSIEKNFKKWLKRHDEKINVHPKGPTFILPPLWFKR